ncbi:MAG: nucleoside triphosphate pyrophosphohydrolase [Acidobacteriota bacterium]|nr:nucleoside triphosphate pyrophosphohydrolase [Acidobacteriota bacterium]
MSDRLQALEQLVATLRGPNGCPWDQQQTLEDTRAYLLEEAHEAASAIDTGNLEALAEELGDVLFQIVFVATLAAEAGASDLTEIIARVHRKMIDRHPHVFGDHRLPDSAAVRSAWEKRKLERRKGPALADLPPSLPSLLTAYRMSQKVAALGFDWPDATSIIDKLYEELGELRVEIGDSAADFNLEAVREEVGDLLFAAANLARRLGIDPDAALGSANRKFRRRFESMEEKLAARDQTIGDVSTEELDRAWDEVKSEEERTPE